MRVGVDRTKYQIQVPLPPKIDPSVTMMTVEEKPDITYADIGGCKEQIEKMREVVELPMLHPVSLSFFLLLLCSVFLRCCQQENRKNCKTLTSLLFLSLNLGTPF